MWPTYLTLETVDQIIRLALEEDLGEAGDVTSTATLPAITQATAHLSAKEGGILAGVGVAQRVLYAVDPSLHVSFLHGDGEHVHAGQHIATFFGAARSLLTAERTLLNFMQRMSGIATATHAFVKALEGTQCTVLDTRKTAPGMRALDKWSVLIGGGRNHRIGLFDRILIKDNHIDAAGGLPEALRRAIAWRAIHHPEMDIEVEVRTLEEVDQALGVGGMQFLLLDNMTCWNNANQLDTTLLYEAVQRIGGKVKTEASGNVTLHTVRQIADTGVDFVSSGALTHSVTALDLSLTIAVH